MFIRSIEESDQTIIMRQCILSDVLNRVIHLVMRLTCPLHRKIGPLMFCKNYSLPQRYVLPLSDLCKDVVEKNSHQMTTAVRYSAYIEKHALNITLISRWLTAFQSVRKLFLSYHQRRYRKNLQIMTMIRMRSAQAFLYRMGFRYLRHVNASVMLIFLIL